jgi:hypothetical protein
LKRSIHHGADDHQHIIDHRGIDRGAQFRAMLSQQGGDQRPQLGSSRMIGRSLAQTPLFHFQDAIEFGPPSMALKQGLNDGFERAPQIAAIGGCDGSPNYF